MEQSSQQTDLAQQEAAARDYKPQLEGAMVGEKMPSHVITEEYAQADPIYVAKTMALPQTFSHYRPIQGDGNCGWRAIVFAYFEALLKLQDMQKIEDEKIRLTNLNDLNNVLTEDELEMIEPFRDEVAELFNQVLAAVSAGQDPVCLLMDKFNDINTSPAILYYFRLLTASELQRFPERYVGFIPDGVSCFIDTVVKVVDKEIEHMCIEPLCDLLLREKGIGIGLEIAYLDRSEGSEVNRHLFPGSTNGQDPMYLLYRPGHYDILYRDNVYRPPQPVPTDPVSLQIHRVTSFTHHHEIQSVGPTLQNFATMDMSTLTMIPPFEAPGLSPLASPLAGSSPMTDPYAPSPQSPWIPQQFPETTPQQALPPARQQPSPPQQQPAASTTIHQLRFSKYNFPNLPEMAESNTTYEPAFQTNTFKNSHFNVAHYNNMNFQPEMYKPDAEDEIPSSASSGRGGGRKRSSEH
ncbi:peptidase C65 Otubain-domain-containing protein [Xylariomycetidae sp. FL2044]|nr:peptidase C65 Otubain-domain-containing protein [Xylariomycetidae sp. FL2044]